MKIVVLEPAEPDSTGAKKIERICSLLESSGHEVLRQTADSGMYAALLQSAPEVVFNLASIYGWKRTNLVPAVLEIAGMRYTGSNLLSLSLARNYTKRFPLLAGIRCSHGGLRGHEGGGGRCSGRLRLSINALLRRYIMTK